MATGPATSVNSHKVTSPVFSNPSTIVHQRSSSNIFFNSNTSISELRRIGEEANIEELFVTWGQAQKQFNEWASNNSSPYRNSPIKPSQKFSKYPFLLTPPPGFEGIKPTYPISDNSTESEISPAGCILSLCEVESNDVKLQPVPNKYGLVKREQRGTFVEEALSEKRVTGEIKFYQLKKRFGFITLDQDQSDIFLCEDDLVLSGVNIKRFKEAVFKKVTQKFSFFVKNYFENGCEKRKAVEIKPV